MTRLRPDHLPDWPRLLSRDLAAAYCGVPVDVLDAVVSVRPVMVGSRRRWDRRALDRWIDEHAGRSAEDEEWLERLDAGEAQARQARPG